MSGDVETRSRRAGREPRAWWEGGCPSDNPEAGVREGGCLCEDKGQWQRAVVRGDPMSGGFSKRAPPKCRPWACRSR